ncbi:uncharacterized 35.5 kDa protein in transposon Tn4556 [Equus caballus]|uniref:uncharacterized 35.5 kDa protein in transposon Tn4556 n=1 Tax=Equus caballus TaxID=9796 RepID=UPI0038B3680C
MQPSHYRRIHCPTLKTSFFKERRNQKEPLGPKCTRNSLYSLAAASGRAVAAHYYTNRYPAGRAGASPRAPAAPGRRSLAPLATGTVQTITISRHFTAEQEREKAQNRPGDKQKYNQLTTSLQTGKGDCATTTTCRGVCMSPAHQHKSINTAAAARAADPRVRRSVRPLPHPPPTRDRERHPSSIIRLQRSERPAQVTPHTAVPSSPPSTRPRPLPPRLRASSRTAGTSSRGSPRRPRPGARGSGPARGEEGRGGTRASAPLIPSPRARLAGRSQLYRRRPSPSARGAHRAHARTDDTQPTAAASRPPAAAARSQPGRPARPEARGPSDGAGRPGRRRAEATLHGQRRAQVSSAAPGPRRPPGEPAAAGWGGGGAGRRRGRKSGEKCEKKQQPLHPRPEKWPAASGPPALRRGCGGGGGG